MDIIEQKDKREQNGQNWQNCKVRKNVHNGQNYLAKSNIVEFVLKRPTPRQWRLLLIDHRIKDFQPFVHGQVGISGTSKATHFWLHKGLCMDKSCKKSHFYFITVIITQLIPKLTLPHFSMNFQFFTIFTSNLTSIWPSSTPKAEFCGLEILFLAANKIRLFSSETKLLCDRVLFCLRFLKTKKKQKKFVNLTWFCSI